MTGWQLTVCYALTLLAGLVLVLAMLPAPQSEVELIVGPPRIINDTPPPLPDRKPYAGGAGTP